MKPMFRNVSFFPIQHKDENFPGRGVQIPYYDVWDFLGQGNHS